MSNIGRAVLWNARSARSSHGRKSSSPCASRVSITAPYITQAHAMQAEFIIKGMSAREVLH